MQQFGGLALSQKTQLSMSHREISRRDSLYIFFTETTEAVTQTTVTAHFLTLWCVQIWLLKSEVKWAPKEFPFSELKQGSPNYPPNYSKPSILSYQHLPGHFSVRWEPGFPKTHPSIHPSIHPSNCLSVCPSTPPSVPPSIRQSIHPPHTHGFSGLLRPALL